MRFLNQTGAELRARLFAMGPGRYYQPAYRFIVADIGQTEGAWLDLGCGPGWLCAYAAAGNPQLDVVGIDEQESTLRVAELAREGRLNVTLKKMSPAQIVYPERTFNVATALQVAASWPDAAAVFAEVYRVLTEGGRLFVYEPDPDGEIPSDWLARPAGVFPPDAAFRFRWRRAGLGADGWQRLLDTARSSPFADGVSDERHGFFRRLVLTK